MSKFVYESVDEVVVTKPQCNTCIKRQTPTTCSEFGEIPTEHLLNEEECDKKVQK